MASNFKTYTYDLLLDLVDILYHLTFADEGIRNGETECIPETLSNTKLNFPLRQMRDLRWRRIKKGFRSYVLDFILFTSIERLSSKKIKK